MEYTRDITVNFTPSGEIPVVRVKQGDTMTRFIRIRLIRGDEPYIPGSEQVILFREEKPDGHGVLVDNTWEDETLHRCFVVNNGDGTVTVELVSQMTACAGYCKCDLCFQRGDYLISTAPFLLDVEAAPGITDSIVSSDDFRTLIDALRDVGLSSVTNLSDMADVSLDGAQDGQIIVYNAVSQKWENKSITDYEYQTEQNVQTIVSGYGYQTESDVNTLIAAYIQALDGNNVRY